MRTDANGDFAFEHLPDDRYAVFMLEAPYNTLTFLFPAVAGGAVARHDADVVIALTSPPAASDVTETRTLRGRLVHHGVPLDHVALELCDAHGWARADPTPSWNDPHRDITRIDADGAFTFLHAPGGDVQIGILELPYYPHVVFARAGAVDLGTKRVTTPAEQESYNDYDDDTAETWPDLRR